MLRGRAKRKTFFLFFETWLRESEARSKFVWVHKAECWKSVWSSRPREMNPICMLVLRGWTKQMPLIFENPVWVKVNPGQNLFESTGLINENQFFLCRPKDPNPIFMLGLRGWAKRMPIKMTKPTEGMWTQVKFVWVYKAEWWESVWLRRPREMNPLRMLVFRGWAKQVPIKFEKPG